MPDDADKLELDDSGIRAHEDRLRAEGAEQRTRNIVGWLRARFEATDRSAANHFADRIVEAFLSTAAPVTNPSRAPVFTQEEALECWRLMQLCVREMYRDGHHGMPATLAVRIDALIEARKARLEPAAHTPEGGTPSINQCDGCRRGLSVDANGIHRDDYPSGNQRCTAERYGAPAATPAGPPLQPGEAFETSHDDWAEPWTVTRRREQKVCKHTGEMDWPGFYGQAPGMDRDYVFGDDEEGRIWRRWPAEQPEKPHDFDTCPLPPDRCPPCREAFRARRAAEQAAASPIVTAPTNSAPIPPGGYSPKECPCCFSEDTPEGADCFCPDWCPEPCKGGEVHR